MVGLKLLVLALSVTALFAAYEEGPLCEPDWKMVASGNDFTLALAKNGSLYSFGTNAYGGLGIGNTYYPITYKTIPQRVMAGTNFKYITAGHNSAFAITTSGSLYAWGSNAKNVLGLGTYYTDNIIYTPRQIGSGYNWKTVAVGKGHALALTTSGELYVWGDNNFGQLGPGLRYNVENPEKIYPFDTFTSITAGDFFSLVILSTGDMYGWGINNSSQLANTTSVQKGQAVKVGAGKKWKLVSSGSEHTLAIDQYGSLYGWGRNWNGEVGVGKWSSDPIKEPKLCAGDSSASWRAVTASHHISFGIKTNGDLLAWGDGNHYQLGKGDNQEVEAPIQVGQWTLSWLNISAGYTHTAGLTSDGRIRTWGKNDKGQLGGGNTITRKTPPTCQYYTPTPTPTPKPDPTPTPPQPKPKPDPTPEPKYPSSNSTSEGRSTYSSSSGTSSIVIVMIIFVVVGVVVAGCYWFARRTQAKQEPQIDVAATTTQLIDFSGTNPQFIMHQTVLNQRL